MVWEYIIIGVETLLLIGALIFILITLNKKKDLGLEPNQTIVWNMDKDTANGHTTLLENKRLGSTRGLESFAFYPLDVYYSDNLDADESHLRTQLITAHIPEGLKLDLPRGSFSSHRNHSIILPRDPNRISQGLKDTILGQAMTHAVINNKIQQDIVRLTREGYTDAVKIMEQAGFFEVSSRIMKQNEKIMFKFTEEQLKERKEGGDITKPITS